MRTNSKHARIQNSSAMTSSSASAVRNKKLEDELKKANEHVANMTASAARASTKIELLMRQKHAVAATNDEIVSQLQQQLREQSGKLESVRGELASFSKTAAITESNSRRSSEKRTEVAMEPLEVSRQGSFKRADEVALSEGTGEASSKRIKSAEASR